VAAFPLHQDDAWIVNSRNTADEDVVRIVASLAGFEPRITQRADSLDLVHDMILAGLGVGLLPVGRPSGRGVTLRRLRPPDVVLRSYAVTRRGHAAWPPLALVLRLVLHVGSRGQPGVAV
jgi:DNA-binding transcriptional LysR family regulator